MITPILMLLILTTPLALHRLMRTDVHTASAWGAGLLFLFTASGHFLQAGPMAQMLPAWVPHRDMLVIATGILEVIIAAGLFTRRFRLAAGAAALGTLVLFFPANVYAAFQHVPLGGHAWGAAYLLIRLPLQAILVAWAWFLVIRPASRAARQSRLDRAFDKAGSSLDRS